MTGFLAAESGQYCYSINGDVITLSVSGAVGSVVQMAICHIYVP